MKSLKLYAVAAVLITSLASLAAYSQNPAKFNKSGGNTQAQCTYTGLSITNGALDVTCQDDVQYTAPTGGGTGPYTLTVSSSPTNGGTVSGAACAASGSGCSNSSVPASTGMSVTATPATGYTFANWSGGPCTGSTNPTCSWTMTGGVNMQAMFQSTSTGGGGGPLIPPGCTGLTPTTNHVAMATLGPGLQSTKFTGAQGTVYSFPLPTSKGSFGTTTTVFTPGGLAVEIGISQCPGDLNYYKTAPAQVTIMGKSVAPCGGLYGAESGGVTWATVQSYSRPVCLTPTGQNWYVNVRFNSGCSTGTCEIYYFWNP